MQTIGRWMAAFGAAAVTAAAPLAAQTNTYAAFLNGAQEVPPTGSPGTGTGVYVWNVGAGTLNVNMTFGGLLSPTVVADAGVAAHLHIAPPGAVGPVIVPLVAFPVGVTSGTYNMLLDLNTLLTPTQRTALAAALTPINASGVTNVYANIHTAQFPTGEIRGQLATVPEPTTVALMTTGLLGIGAAARRRRNALGVS